MEVYCPKHPIYRGVIVHTVHYFHRLSSHLHHICTSGDAREGSPHAQKYRYRLYRWCITQIQIFVACFPTLTPQHMAQIRLRIRLLPLFTPFLLNSITAKDTLIPPLPSASICQSCCHRWYPPAVCLFARSVGPIPRPNLHDSTQNDNNCATIPDDPTTPHSTLPVPHPARQPSLNFLW
jgi:hypothetical protein